jgi:hypothetical protein
MPTPFTAAALLWKAAGSPTAERAEATPPGTRCWWCGASAHPTGRPISTLPDSFMATIPRGEAQPDSEHLCNACGWTLSDWVSLPETVWGPQLDKALAGDGKVSLALGDDRGAKASITAAPDGAVYVFARPPAGKRGPAIEAAWTAGRELAASGDLSAMPAELPLLATMSRGDVGGAMVGKFRNYDHMVIGGVWHVLKAARPSDRDLIRATLLSPPPGLWALSIGDGQKHSAYVAPVSHGGAELQAIYCDGAGVVTYAPTDLAAILGAVEALIIAGAHPEEVGSGRYRPRGDMVLINAVRSHDPALVPWRGSPLFVLAERIRRSTDAIRADAPAEPPQPEAAPVPAVPAPTVPSLEATYGEPAPTHSQPGLPAPAVPAREDRAPAEGPRSRRPAQRQLGLFG